MNDEIEFDFMLEVEDSQASSPKKKRKSKLKAEDDGHPLYKRSKTLLKGMKARDLHAILQKDFIPFCQEHGLLPKSVKCFCNANMRLEARPPVKNSYTWICRKKDHEKRHGLKKGTWFENSHMGIPDILWIMYMWVYRYSTGLMMHECDNGPNSVIGWSRRCLEVCQMILELRSEPLGGENRVVEIFECKFNKSKLEEENSEKWAFFALQQDSTKSLLIIVEDKTSNCIRQIFNKYIIPGTIVVSMFWSPYTNLTNSDFEYLTNQLLLNFYDSTTKVTMNTFEKFVSCVNRHQPLTHLVKNEYEASFFEKMYRKSLSNAPDAYLAFLKDVASVYKPLDVASVYKPLGPRSGSKPSHDAAKFESETNKDEQK